jgi:hypothetical protein
MRSISGVPNSTPRQELVQEPISGSISKLRITWRFNNIPC